MYETLRDQVHFSVYLGPLWNNDTVYRYIYFTSELIFCLIISCSDQSVFFKTVEESHMLRICFPLVFCILLCTSHCRKVTSPTKFRSVHNFHTVNSHNRQEICVWHSTLLLSTVSLLVLNLDFYLKKDLHKTSENYFQM